MATGSKACTKCGKVQPLSAFCRRQASKDGLSHHCTVCRAKEQKAWRTKNPRYARQQRLKRPAWQNGGRKSWLKKKYGLTTEEYERMYNEQRGVCAICGQPEPNAKHSLSVDHDHVTGQIRGLLCHQCNLALGNMGENSDRLRRAALYLENYRVN